MSRRPKTAPKRVRGARTVRDKRGRWIMIHVYYFCQRNGWWGSAIELAHHTKRGSVRTMIRELAMLRSLGLIEMPKRGRWALTGEGFELVGLPPITPTSPWRISPRAQKRLKRERRERLLADSQRVLDTPPEA